MDKAQLHHFLSGKSTPAANDESLHELEKLTKEYPYFASAQYALFSAKTKTTSADIARLAFYKSDPLLFATFVKSREKLREKPEEVTAANEEFEDILTLINELPNSNPIETARESRVTNEEKITENNDVEEIKEFHLPANNRFDFSAEAEEDKSLMVMMSFTDWLFHFKNKTEREKQEEKEKKALKTSWQKEKLAAVSEEENEEIPEEIFKQAMDSISENTIISESLAIILGKQGKTDKAVEMYKKLSLRNPEKNVYFADRIKELTTSKDY